MRALTFLTGLLIFGAATANDLDFWRYDVDNNGYLTELEWEKADFGVVPFSQADTNNNLQIEREEAFAVAEEVGYLEDD